jgi:hypothetical protein
MRDDLSAAIREVEQGHAQRIAKPGCWRVWRDDSGVHWEVLA